MTITLQEISRRIGADRVFLDLQQEPDRTLVLEIVEYCLTNGYFDWSKTILPFDAKESASIYNRIKADLELRKKTMSDFFNKHKDLYQVCLASIYRNGASKEMSQKAWYYLGFYIYYLLAAQGDLSET